ncbi:hypothetical protein D3C81_1867870 [compost metagenome]
MQGFAAVQRLQAGQQVGLLFDGVGDAEQDVRALLRCGSRPAGEGSVGGEDGGFDLFAAGFGNVRQYFTGGRVEDGLDEALAGDQFTIDQQCGGQRGLRASHFTGSLFLYGHGAPCDWGPDRLIDVQRLVVGLEDDKYQILNAAFD